MKYADIKAQSDFKREEKLHKLDTLTALYEEILQNNDCVSIKDLAVTGRDLMTLGIPEGPGMKEVLLRLLDAVIDEPSLNNRDSLIELVKKDML